MTAESETLSLRREPADPCPDPRRVAGMPLPGDLLAQAVRRGAFEGVSRRAFVGAAVSLGLAACAGPKATTASGAKSLPMGEWREPPFPKQAVSNEPVSREAGADSGAAPDPAPTVASSDKPASPPREFNPVGEAALPWAKPRFLWAKGQPIRSDLNPMLPVTCVTVHHDGLDELFWGTKPAEVAARLERYRVGHLARGWADIGYHLAIDRGGVLWQGRAIRWQGAHVHLHNEGNIGVLVMGNFDQQTPSFAQMATLRRVLTELRSTYRIQRGEVYTHKEWKDAQTACPGAALQPRVEKLRKSMGA